LNLRGTR
jgi:hypothetical protein